MCVCVIYDPTGGAKTPLMTPPFTLRFSLYDEFGAMVDLVVLGAGAETYTSYNEDGNDKKKGGWAPPSGLSVKKHEKPFQANSSVSYIHKCIL